jgi:hypothetical protein
MSIRATSENTHESDHIKVFHLDDILIVDYVFLRFSCFEKIFVFSDIRPGGSKKNYTIRAREIHQFN